MSTHEFSALVAAAYQRVGFPGDASCQVDNILRCHMAPMQPQTILEGDIVLIDDGCTVDGYQSDISRTFVYRQAHRTR